MLTRGSTREPSEIFLLVNYPFLKRHLSVDSLIPLCKKKNKNSPSLFAVETDTLACPYTL
jgi:hypothetical protein